MTSKQASNKRTIVNVDDKTYIVQVATGEVVRDASNSQMIVYEPRQNKRTAPFLCAYQDDFRRLATLPLTKTQNRVLLFCLGCMDFNNFIRVPQSEIAIALDLMPSEVSKTFRALEKTGLFVVRKTALGGTTRQVSGHVAFKGSTTLLRELQQTQEEILACGVEGSTNGK